MTLLAAGEAVHVDAVARPAEQELDAVVHQPLAVHPLAHAGLVEQVDADLLEDAGADAAEHVLAAHPLDDDVVDPGVVQQLAEQQARGTGADDGDLRPHGFSRIMWPTAVFEAGTW